MSDKFYYVDSALDAPLGPFDSEDQAYDAGRTEAARKGLDELGLARAIRDGSLKSPQVYENVHLWDIRITGTGAAYRRALDEYVWRDPALYLNDEFLARCNGLAVIWEHPEGATLTSKEFSNRSVGTVLLPYIKGQEVWAIAKIYDGPTNKILSKEKMSTSPAVVFRDPSVNEKVELEDGSKLLIEGKPSLLDHIALCEKGVWDKGGDPTGVVSHAIGDSDMTEEEKALLAAARTIVANDTAAKAARADAEKEEKEKEEKADADAGKKLDKLLSHQDAMSKRMDAMEARFAKKDAEEEEAKKKADESEGEEKEEEAEETEAKEVVADKKKKDAVKSKKDGIEDLKKEEKKEDEDDKKEEKEEKADAKADSDVASIRKEVEELKAARKPLTDEDFRALASAQSRADEVFQAFGSFAPRPMDGETLLTYRRRLAGQLKKHSPEWKGVDLAAVADSEAFTVAEKRIYADAVEASKAPEDLKEGELRAITRTDSETGQRMTTFVGSRNASGGQSTFIGIMKRPSRRVTRLGLPKEN